MICLIRLQVGQTSIFGKIHSEKPQESEFLSNFLAETCRLVNTLSTPFEFRLSVTTDLIEFLNSSKWPQILKTQEKKIRIRPFSFIKKISDLKMENDPIQMNFVQFASEYVWSFWAISGIIRLVVSKRRNGNVGESQ